MASLPPAQFVAPTLTTSDGGGLSGSITTTGMCRRRKALNWAVLKPDVTTIPAAADHPITAGLGDFDLVTEQYWVLADDYIDVLATTTQKVREWDPWHREVTSPAIWTRQWGKGRIFVCTPGHRVEILQDSNVRTIIERGLLWASR